MWPITGAPDVEPEGGRSDVVGVLGSSLCIVRIEGAVEDIAPEPEPVRDENRVSVDDRCRSTSDDARESTEAPKERFRGVRVLELP